jgi:hypothetical protein
VIVAAPDRLWSWLAVAPAAAMAATLGRFSISAHDVVLYALLACLFTAIRAAAGGSFRRAEAYMAAAGALGAGGLFWTYDRGLIGLASLAVGAAWTVACSRRGGPGVAAIAGALAVFAGLALAGGAGAMTAHLENILYWVGNSWIWNYTVDSARFWHGILPAAEFVAAMLLLAAYGLFVETKLRNPAQIGIIVILVIVQVIFAKLVFNRTDLPHIVFVFSPGFLIFASTAGTVMRSLARPAAGAAAAWWRRPAPGIALLAVAAATAIDGLVLYDPAPLVPDTDRQPIATFRANLLALAGLPADASLMPDNLRPVAAAIAASASRCTYVITNEGMLYFWSGKRSCSRFIYPVYAAPRYGQRIIADLEAAPPDVIVYDSPFWSARIDARPQTRRTPDLMAWIDRHYRFGETINGYILRAATPRPGFTAVP